MTKAEIILAARYLVNELSNDAGALMSDTGNLQDFVYDAQEQVVLDLVNVMPDQILTTEDVGLTASTSYSTLTTTFWQVWSVQVNLSDETPREIRIIDPSDMQYFKYNGQTTDYPPYCYFTGSRINWVPTPSGTVASYARVYMIRPEAVSMGTDGPAYLPPVTHRLIAYQAAVIAGTAFGAITTGIEKLYARRFYSIRKTWAGRFHQQPRFVKESILSRTTFDDRDEAFYDTSGFFD